MNGERIFKIIVMELASDALKLEEELEKTINSDMEVEVKTNTIKQLLAKIVNIEACTDRFNKMVSFGNNENNEKINKE
jgi:hypothetical protein